MPRAVSRAWSAGTAALARRWGGKLSAHWDAMTRFDIVWLPAERPEPLGIFAPAQL